MRKLLFLTISVLVIMPLASFFNQRAYYYYANNERIELIPVDNKLVVRFINNYKGNIANIPLNQTLRKHHVEWRDDSTIVITTSNKSEKIDLADNLKKLADVNTCNTVYRVNSGGELDITDEFVVRFKDSATKAQIDSIHKRNNVKTIKIDKIYQLLKVKQSADALSIANNYQESGLVVYSHPNFYAKIETYQTIPNDEYFNMQFYLHNTSQVFNDGHSGLTDADIDATEAWSITKGDNNIVIAVLDQGVTADHPDLPNSRQIRLNGSNFTNSGSVNDPSPTESDNHGNGCSGIIAATQNNGQGISGIAPNCRIMPVKISYGLYFANTEKIAAAILTASRNGAHIISNSWGYKKYSNSNQFPNITNAVWEAGTRGRNGLGCIITFAASNTADHVADSNGTITFPSNIILSSILTVGASDRYDKQANYSPLSNTSSPNNQMIDLVAPSNRSMPWQSIPNETGEVWSIDIPGLRGYNPWRGPYYPQVPDEELPNWGKNYSAYTGRFGGTSAACPQVAGVAALILSVNPNLTHFEVFNILTRTSDKVGGYTYTNGRSNELGYGRLNAYRAISQAIAINGPENLCASDNYKLGNLDNLPSDWNVTWSVTPSNIVSLNQTNGYITLTPTGKGKVILTANLQTQYPSDTRTITKTIWVGAPNTPIITGKSTLGCGESSWYYMATYSIEQPELVTYQWSGENMQVIGANNQLKCYLKMYGGPPNNVICRAYNGCYENGLNYVEGIFPVLSDCYAMAVYPNPAKDMVEISILENSTEFESNNTNKEIRIFDNQNNLKKLHNTNQKNTIINIADLKTGIYFIQVTYKGVTIVKQLVISK